MRRLLAATAVASLLVGCRAPTPSMNMLTPYGAATVPAPATGTVGNSGDYYAPPTPPPATGTTSGGSQLQPPGAFMGTGSVSTATADSAVVPASYTPGTTARTTLPDSQKETSTTPSSNLKLNGMRVNDGTSAARPQPQGEPVNLTQLPDASQTPTFLRILSPGSSSATHSPTPAAAPTTASGNWQQR